MCQQGHTRLVLVSTRTIEMPGLPTPESCPFCRPFETPSSRRPLTVYPHVVWKRKNDNTVDPTDPFSRNIEFAAMNDTPYHTRL